MDQWYSSWESLQDFRVEHDAAINNKDSEDTEKTTLEVNLPTSVSKPRGRPPGKKSKNQFGRKSKEAKKKIIQR